MNTIMKMMYGMNSNYIFCCDKIDRIYFFIHCLYNAKTELYDRSLTDMRSEYDQTSAFIFLPDDVRRSRLFAKRLYEQCKIYLEDQTGEPFDVLRWRNCIKGHQNMSAQGWIDLYNIMKKEKDFKEEYLNRKE